MFRLVGTPHYETAADGWPRLPAATPYVLAQLRLRFGGRVDRGLLAETLWPDADLSNAYGSLRTVLKGIRAWEEAAGVKLVEAGTKVIALDPSCAPLDLDLYRSARPAEAGRFVYMCSGELLEGAPLFGGDEVQTWLELERSAVKQNVADWALKVVGEADSQVAADMLVRLMGSQPENEGVFRAWMLHLSKTSTVGAVRQAYAAFAARLRNDLETEPELETRELAATLIPGFGVSRPAEPMSAEPPKAATSTASVPRILILPPETAPFRFEQQQVALAKAFVEDVTLTLSRARLYAVYAPFTARQLVGQEHGAALPNSAVDYVVRTRLRPGRSTASPPTLGVSLVLTQTDEVLFGDEINFWPGELLDLHYALSGMFADRVAGRVAREEVHRFRKTGAASAYTHYLLARQFCDLHELGAIRRARKSLKRAMQLSPEYVPAIGQIARTLTFEWLELGREERDLLFEAQIFASRAVELDPMDSGGRRELGQVALYLHQLDDALQHFELAEKFAPHHADLLADQADVLAHSSELPEAERRIELALSLNPLAPDDYYWVAGAISFFRERYQEGLDRLLRMKNPGLAYRLMAACAAMKGDREAAAAYREKSLLRDPAFQIEKWSSLYPQRDKRHTEHYLHALRLAGFQ